MKGKYPRSCNYCDRQWVAVRKNVFHVVKDLKLKKFIKSLRENF
jgi:hypothetical protein